jgi:hypothetical protein
MAHRAGVPAHYSSPTTAAAQHYRHYGGRFPGASWKAQALAERGSVASDQYRLAACRALTGPSAVEEDTACCYAVQDKVRVTGPGAEPWEVYVVNGDADVLDKAAGSACCSEDTVGPMTMTAGLPMAGARPGVARSPSVHRVTR